MLGFCFWRSSFILLLKQMIKTVDYYRTTVTKKLIQTRAVKVCDTSSPKD